MLNIDEKKLLKLANNENYSLVDLANEFNCCKKTISNRLEKLGIKNKYGLIKEFQDISGQRFGRLVVTEFSHRDKFHKPVWNCICDCGRQRKINGPSMQKGLTKSCGCLKRATLRKKGCGQLSHGFWRKLEKSAYQRGYDFDLSIKDGWDLFNKQNGLCAISKVPIILFPDSNRERLQTASPDRIDSTKGYIKGNFQWVHKRINRIKNILSVEELVFWSRHIVLNNKKVEINIDVNNVTWN